VAAVSLLRDLQFHRIDGHAVIVPDGSLKVLAQDLGDLCALARHERGANFLRRLLELQIRVGSCHVGDAVQSQLVHQAFLMGAKSPF
jgi:hypothetical protein